MQDPLLSDPFTHRHFYTKTLLPFLHTHFHRQNLLRTDAFTHRQLFTTKFAQRRPSTTSYDKACSKHFPRLLPLNKACKTPQSISQISSYFKICTNTSQEYFVLQSLHKGLSSTTSCYKTYTKHFPVLLRTLNFAQRTSQYYFELQNLHKVRPNTTSYYKTCRKYLPVLLGTTKPQSL